MLGRRPSNTPRPEDRGLIRQILRAGWWAVATFGIAFMLVDAVLVRVADDVLVRVALRWSILSLTALLLTVVFSRRTVRLLNETVSAERAARNEAEAMAELTASIAAGNSIHETLS